jgi:hypothetical protein
MTLVEGSGMRARTSCALAALETGGTACRGGPARPCWDDAAPLRAPSRAALARLQPLPAAPHGARVTSHTPPPLLLSLPPLGCCHGLRGRCDPHGAPNLLTGAATESWKAVRRAVAVSFSTQNIKVGCRPWCPQHEPRFLHSWLTLFTRACCTHIARSAFCCCAPRILMQHCA